jgi:hypothetical protein
MLGIVVATTSFTVLTATSKTSQLRTTATVGAHFRSAYDILVRPEGTQSAIEQRAGTVQPNFLAGIYGGITLDQWHAIQDIPGVQVAAPIAMVGTVLPSTYLAVPVRKYLTSSPRQLFRIKTTWVSQRGLTRVPQPDSFVYVTSSKLKGFGVLQDDSAMATEETSDGAQVRTCGAETSEGGAADPFGPGNRSSLECWSLQNGRGGFGDFVGALTTTNPGYPLVWSVPLLVAGVDPASEAQLAQLDQAVIAGRYLREDDAKRVAGVPVLVSKDSGVDDTVSVEVERMPDPTGPLPVIPVADLPTRLTGPGTSVGTTTFTAQSAYQQLLQQVAGKTNTDLLQDLDGYWQSGPSDYTVTPGAALKTVVRSNSPQTWASLIQFSGAVRAPMANADTAFRSLVPHVFDPMKQGAVLRSVGVFDPAKLPAFDPLADVNLGLYTPVSVTAGDTPSQQALKRQELLPNSALTGYLRQPPQLITTLDGVKPFYSSAYGGRKHAADPISVVRVRVAGVVGPDAVSRERVNQVAEQIAVRTGLQVDLVVGSSPAPTAVQLTAGEYGRPLLALSEGWVKKNVAVTILEAVNRKSLVLFTLILAVCALFVANGVGAAVRTRRTELGVLACLGWSRRHLYTAVLTEVLVVGVVAGTIGSLIAIPLGQAMGLQVSTSRAALAVPAAVLLALIAGAVPAWRASRADPGAAVRPAVSTSRRARSPRGIAGLALTNVQRTPGRSWLAATSLAVGAAALTLLVGITLAFRGVVVGSLLGDAVAVQVRGVDYIAVVATLALGVLAVADVLFLNLRERAGELATLRATGWTESSLSRLVVIEGAVLGLAGALPGAALGLIGTALFAGSLPARLPVIAALVLLGAAAVTAMAALVPAQLLRRLPTAPLLAED